MDDPSNKPTPLFSRVERRSMLRDAVTMLSSSHIAVLFGAITSVLLRKVLGPSLMGIWATRRIALDYGNYSSLGINRAAGLEIAISEGRSEQKRVTEIADIATTIEVASGIVVALTLLCLGAYQASQGKPLWSLAFALASVNAVISRFHAFNLTVLRSKKRFAAISTARATGAATDLLFLLGGAWLWGFPGLLIGSILAVCFHAWFVRLIGGLRFRPMFDRPLTLELLRKGWVMAGAAAALVFLRSIDRLVIVNSFPDGDHSLGLYSVGMLVGSLTFDQSTLIANVTYPRLAETLGKTNDPAIVIRVGLRTAELLALCMVVVAGLVLTIGLPFLVAILPKYRDGMQAASGALAAGVLLGISMPIRYALVTVGRTKLVMVVTLICAALLLAGGLWISSHSMDLRKMAWTSAAASGLCLLLLLLVSLVISTTLLPVVLPNRRGHTLPPPRRTTQSPWILSVWTNEFVGSLMASAYVAGGIWWIGTPQLSDLSHWPFTSLWMVLACAWILMRFDWRSLLKAEKV